MSNPLDGDLHMAFLQQILDELRRITALLKKQEKMQAAQREKAVQR